MVDIQCRDISPSNVDCVSSSVNVSVTFDLINDLNFGYDVDVALDVGGTEIVESTFNIGPNRTLGYVITGTINPMTVGCGQSPEVTVRITNVDIIGGLTPMGTAH